MKAAYQDAHRLVHIPANDLEAQQEDELGCDLDEAGGRHRERNSAIAPPAAYRRNGDRGDHNKPEQCKGRDSRPVVQIGQDLAEVGAGQLRRRDPASVTARSTVGPRSSSNAARDPD